MIIQADILKWAETYTGPLFHALLCDPPYHLTEITKRFGKTDAAPAQYGSDGAFQRASRGFMGKQWDGGDIAFRPETWAALGRLLHPGAFGMAFASTRGFHRMAVAIEDAGFIIHPTVFCWAFGSGFPKATRIPHDSFEGHRYGLQALKPAGEPIVTFSKPHVCYNEIQQLSADISLMLEELWKGFANSAETVTKAEQTVRFALDRVAIATEKHAEPTFVSDAAKNSSVGNRKSKKAAEPTAPLNAKTQKTDSGMTAPTAENKSINGHQPLQGTPVNTCIAANRATQSIETSSEHEPVSNVENSLPPIEAVITDSTAHPSADTHQRSDRRSKIHSGTADATDIRLAILQYSSARVVFDLSTIWLWNIIWDDLSSLVSKCITGTELKIIMTLRTLNSSLLRLTLANQDIASEKNSSDKLWLYAAPVNAHFSGLLTSLLELRPSAQTASLNPIIVFQKPYAGRPVDSITRTGAGALNIEAGRIGTESTARKDPRNGNLTNAHMEMRPWMRERIMNGEPLKGDFDGNQGRWPANLILSHAPDCNGECVPGCPVAALGEQSGESSSPTQVTQGKRTGGSVPYGSDFERIVAAPGDSGTAARFFFQADYMAERLEAADAVQYQAKASRGEREAGLDPRTVALMRKMDDSDFDELPMSTRPGRQIYGHFADQDFDETTVSDGRETPIDNPYQRGKTVRRNTHPTIKPIALVRYLATLLLPPDMYAPRRLLIPFSGAGSEIIGADLAGWEEVVGVELEDDHVKIAEARRAYWQQRRWELSDPARPITSKTADAPDGQLDMFLED